MKTRAILWQALDVSAQVKGESVTLQAEFAYGMGIMAVHFWSLWE